MPLLTTTITNAILTAYCACGAHAQCPKGTLTASGVRPIQSHTVAVSRQIPLGSTVTITDSRGNRRPGLRNTTFVAEDRFNKRFEQHDNIKRVDIFFGTNHAAAVKFGRQTGVVTYTIYGHP